MPAKCLMVQGTGSSVGKSVLVTALCRIFKQRGFKVAPFKAQNMSLNSYVTADGGEIGRAQAVQAEAAGVAPMVAMNPVLLKPEADNRSQVIIAGKPVTRISATDFPRLKMRLWDAISESIDVLRNHCDVVVIEGAGSPAEINLKDRDLVNMKVALHCRAPVLLAADIDRGGVFASLVGTLELLEPPERALVQGFIINKFRGDISLLEPGLHWLEKRTSIPVAGVIPYYHDIRIAEEDSIALETRRVMKTRSDFSLDIAVIGLPHIANFDDFDPLARDPSTRLRYVEAGDSLGAPDLIILPGTKSTMSDLARLKEVGLAKEIQRRAFQGCPVIGICGGFQMLGEEILDPDHIESDDSQISGLRLLPVATRFLPAKSTHQVKAHTVVGRGILAKARNTPISGYEIHMGQTSGPSAARPFRIDERSGQTCSDTDGFLSEDGSILGTYLHGIFHNADFRRAILSELAERKGTKLASTTESFSVDEQYDRLADHVRKNLNMDFILKLLDRR